MMKRFLFMTALSTASVTATSFALAAAASPPPACPNATPLPSISVSPSSYTFLNGTSIDPTDIVPTSTGAVSFTISPDITNRTGLSFNTNTGIVSGTPTAGKSATSYTISAVNCLGKKASTTISVTVNDVAPTISIPSGTYTFLVGAKIEDVVPVLDASVTSVSISPDITATGLTFNKNTGKISGTPTSALDATYVMTALNGTGQAATAALYVGVNNMVPATAPPPAAGPGCEYTLFIADFQSTNASITSQQVYVGGVPLAMGSDGFYHVPLTDSSGNILVDSNDATPGGATVPFGVWEVQRSAASFLAGNSGHQNDGGAKGYVAYKTAAVLNCPLDAVTNTRGANGFEIQSDGAAAFGDADADSYSVAGNVLYALSSTTTASDLLQLTFNPSSWSEFPTPTASSYPVSIISGPDGNLWFTELASNIGSVTPAGVVTEYPTTTPGAYPNSITVGPDGALWFTENSGNNIGRITTSGQMTEYPLPSNYPNAQLASITTGPDGNLWFTAVGYVNAIGTMTTDGTVTFFPQLPADNARPLGITTGPDGNLWFTEYGGNNIGRMTTGGVLTDFPLPTDGSFPWEITVGPDGNIWFIENGTGANRIGTITTDGVITEYPTPTISTNGSGITVGSDGNLWFAVQTGLNDTQTGNIGRITPSGVVTEFTVPYSGSQPSSIAGGPDGNIWFTDQQFSSVDRFIIP